jgi:vacuolar iron transporter family protein
MEGVLNSFDAYCINLILCKLCHVLPPARLRILCRGLSAGLARQVAEELTAKDVIRAHARDELGIDLDDMANPLQASLVSLVAFTLGAIMPLLAGAFLADWRMRLLSVILVTSIGLGMFGYLGSALGGARVAVGSARVLVGGLLAMAITYGVGTAFGTRSSG